MSESTIRLRLKNKAKSLRKQGKTYSEIQDMLGPLAKSTLSNWLKPIELTKIQKDRIQRKITDRSALGRQKGGWTNHQKRLTRIAKIQSAAQKEFIHLCNDGFFLTGLVLYLAEGSRKVERFQFMNSDPFLIKIMIKWLYRFHKISIKEIWARLYTHKISRNEHQEKFWSNFLNIPFNQFLKTIYKPTPHKIKKNPEYRGCLRIEISGTELFWKIMKWRDMLYDNLDK